MFTQFCTHPHDVSTLLVVTLIIRVLYVLGATPAAAPYVPIPAPFEPKPAPYVPTPPPNTPVPYTFGPLPAYPQQIPRVPRRLSDKGPTLTKVTTNGPTSTKGNRQKPSIQLNGSPTQLSSIPDDFGEFCW